MHSRWFLTALLIAAPTVAQETKPASRPSTPPAADNRVLTFAWPAPSEVDVTCKNTRDERTFTTRFRLVIRPGVVDGTLQIGRRDVRVTHWNGQAVPERVRPQLAPMETQIETLPDLIVRTEDGEIDGVEVERSWLARCRRTLKARVEEGHLSQTDADSAFAQLRTPEHQRTLEQQAQRPWDEWIARWLGYNFRSQRLEPFEGECILATGDIVDGTCKAEHKGPVAGSPDLVRLSVDFEAKGGRLEAAAMKWRQQLFGRADDQFEHVRLAVRERAELVVRYATAQPIELVTERKSTVQAGDEERTFVEKREWTFNW